MQTEFGIISMMLVSATLSMGVLKLFVVHRLNLNQGIARKLLMMGQIRRAHTSNIVSAAALNDMKEELASARGFCGELCTSLELPKER